MKLPKTFLGDYHRYYSGAVSEGPMDQISNLKTKARHVATGYIRNGSSLCVYSIGFAVLLVVQYETGVFFENVNRSRPSKLIAKILLTGEWRKT